MKKLLKTLTTLTFSLILSATSYAAEYGVIDFGQLAKDLEKAAPNAIMTDISTNKDYSYILYIIPQKTTILDQPCSAVQYKFFGYGQEKKLYGYEFNLDDRSPETAKALEKIISEKYGKPQLSQDHSTPEQDAFFLKWIYEGKSIMLSHYQYENYRETTITINKEDFEPQEI